MGQQKHDASPAQIEKRNQDIGGHAVGGWMRFGWVGDPTHEKVGGLGMSEFQRTNVAAVHLTCCYEYEGGRGGKWARASRTWTAFIRWHALFEAPRGDPWERGNSIAINASREMAVRFGELGDHPNRFQFQLCL